jgi:hypothetical protein
MPSSAIIRGDPEGDAAEMMKRGIKKREIGNHADVRDTSQMLAVDPSMVRHRTSWKPATARTAWKAIRAMPARKSAAS